MRVSSDARRQVLLLHTCIPVVIDEYEDILSTVHHLTNVYIRSCDMYDLSRLEPEDCTCMARGRNPSEREC
ncbi:hypothetical protein CC79DRAFT_200181 [Sarocladium strictum]